MSDILTRLEAAEEGLRAAHEQQSQAIHDIAVLLQEWIKLL